MELRVKALWAELYHFHALFTLLIHQQTQGLKFMKFNFNFFHSEQFSEVGPYVE